MQIGGVQKTSLLDYPDKISAIVFTKGCNLRCGYCHNPELIVMTKEPVWTTAGFFEFLNSRKGKLDGVVITGGEPCLQSGLIDFIKRIKEIGFLVKLDTNGTFPETLRLALPYLDYIAMDIKNSLDKYPETAGIANFEPSLIERSVEYLAEDRIAYEFRTTVMHELHDEESFRKIAYLVRNCHNYYLQSYSDAGDIINPIFSPPSTEELEAYSAILRTYIENVFIRDR